jgi:formate--tetrahydrofolate ligase
MIKNIEDLASSLGIQSQFVESHGRDKAKISLSALSNPTQTGKLILVSAITPTPAGEGKTTVSIGLAQGLRQLGKKASLALRQPSMGPVFGRKGTATGGGQSSLTPMESINLHFTGDFHAITSAHNLLAAALDNTVHFRTLPLDPKKNLWKRVMDMNDRGLRNIRTHVTAADPEGHASGFDITAASEIMAILCLSESYAELRTRLENILVGFTAEMEPIFAKQSRVTGAMVALLKDALKPNLVQTLEGTPAFVHGGPFANIAHGCNSILATRMSMAFSEYTVTEAGFAFDLGGEKFIDIKCRKAGIAPDAIVLVATVRALKMHGGVAIHDLAQENAEAVALGLENLAAHIDSAKSFGRPVVVAINQFPNDTPAEQQVILDFCAGREVPGAVIRGFTEGGQGAIELASLVAAACEKKSAALPFVYEATDSVQTKLEKIATQIYGANGVQLTNDAAEKLKLIEKHQFGNLPICVAKTQDSLSDNPKLQGRPRNFSISVRDFEIASGAGFLVALTGKLLRMPALPTIPSAERIEMDDNGHISGW